LFADLGFAFSLLNQYLSDPQLTDIYAVITYYLWNRQEVEEYLAERQQVIEESHREIEERFPSQGVRERLLARRDAKTPT
jgi:hypothetical protein